jgi:serine protease inhibitor ecotin
MKNNLVILIAILSTSNLFGQIKPNYPDTKEDLKRIDFVLLKINNSDDYKVEISFSFEFETVECSNASFSFNKSDIEKGYGMDTRFPYYIFNVKESEITVGYNKDCDKTKPKVKRKIYSNYKTIEEYHYAFPIPYYIPKHWNLEYRILKAESEFKTFE